MTRHRPAARLGLVGLVLCGLGLAGCADADPDADADSSPSASPRTSPDASTPGSPTDSPSFSGIPAGVEVTQLDASPVGVAAVDGQAWTALIDTGDVRTGTGEQIPVGTAPLRLVDTPDGVWVSVISDGKVVRIDPGTDKVDLQVRLKPAGSEPEGLTYDGTTVWIVDQANNRVVPLDPGSGDLGTPIKVGYHPRLASAGPSGIWVGNYDGGSVTRITEGQTTTRSIGRCLTPQGLAEAGGVVWVACTVESRVVGLDAKTLEVVAVLDGLTAADAIAVRDGTVYAVGQTGPTIWTIDPSTRKVVAKLQLDDVGATNENVDAAFVGKTLVVTHPNVKQLYDVPLRLLGP